MLWTPYISLVTSQVPCHVQHLSMLLVYFIVVVSSTVVNSTQPVYSCDISMSCCIAGHSFCVNSYCVVDT